MFLSILCSKLSSGGFNTPENNRLASGSILTYLCEDFQQIVPLMLESILLMTFMKQNIEQIIT